MKNLISLFIGVVMMLGVYSQEVSYPQVDIEWDTLSYDGYYYKNNEYEWGHNLDTCNIIFSNEWAFVELGTVTLSYKYQMEDTGMVYYYCCNTDLVTERLVLEYRNGKVVNPYIQSAYNGEGETFFFRILKNSSLK